MLIMNAKFEVEFNKNKQRPIATNRTSLLLGIAFLTLSLPLSAITTSKYLQISVTVHGRLLDLDVRVHLQDEVVSRDSVPS